MPARKLFIPPAYQNRAFIDSPIHVAAQDFNISAPHMHAISLEALKLQPGDRCVCVCVEPLQGTFVCAKAAAL